jgi:hypothetical protein
VLTDADRRLEWRGDAVALPPRTYDLTSDAEARPLDDGEISAGVDAGASALIACVTQAIGSAPLTGEITVQGLLVGGDGRVDKLRARAPAYLHEHGLVPCLRRAARGLRFAATGGADRGDRAVHRRLTARYIRPVTSGRMSGAACGGSLDANSRS